MGIYEIVSQFGIQEILWQESIDKHDVVCDEYDGVVFYRVTKKIGVLEKGAIITEEGVVLDFPRIARILHLENGLHKIYSHPFYVEEKVDGYNLRIVRIQGRVLAFSRGAYVCPFSTDRVTDFIDVKSVFDENPGLIICGEFAGPDNPYNIEHPPYVKEDVRFFAFDESNATDITDYIKFLGDSPADIQSEEGNNESQSEEGGNESQSEEGGEDSQSEDSIQSGFLSLYFNSTTKQWSKDYF